MQKPQIFTPEEIQAMRDALNALRHPGSYEPGKWVVSALNRDPGVVGALAPKRVVVRDISLRTLEQMRGVALTADQRRRVLEAIAQAGVPEIQLSMFGRGYTVAEMASEVAVVKAVNPECAVVYTGASSSEHIRMAADAGVDIVQSGSTPVAGIAPIRMGGAYRHAWEGRDWRDHVALTDEGRLTRLLELVRESQRQGLTMSCAINQLAYASEEWVAEFCREVADAGCKDILLADGTAGCGPEVFARMTRVAKQNSNGARVIIHPHNVYNLAVANALAAVMAGADSIEVSLNGYCAGAGQADMAHVVLSLESLYGIETGVDMSQMTSLARLAEEITGHPLSANYPVTGREVFNLGGSDSIVGELDVDPLIHWNVEPTLVGNVRKWEITRSTGPFTMWQKLDDLQIPVQKSEVEPILRECLTFIQANGRPITDDEIRQLALAQLGSSRESQPTPSA